MIHPTPAERIEDALQQDALQVLLAYWYSRYMEVPQPVEIKIPVRKDEPR